MLLLAPTVSRYVLQWVALVVMIREEERNDRKKEY